MTKPIHIDPRRPWSRGVTSDCPNGQSDVTHSRHIQRERKFGWDALPGTATSIIPDLAPCEGVPVGSGDRSRNYTRTAGLAIKERSVAGTPARPVRDRPTALPSVLGQEAINIVFALCLAAGTLVSAAVSHMEAPDRQVKVYTERME